MIDPNYFATEHDRRVAAGAATMRTIFEQSPIAERVAFETTPASTRDDDELIDAALVAGATGHHAIGTCGMGPNADDVVDDQLRVRGIEAFACRSCCPATPMAPPWRWRGAPPTSSSTAGTSAPASTVCSRTPPESPTTPVRPTDGPQPASFARARN